MIFFRSAGAPVLSQAFPYISIRRLIAEYQNKAKIAWQSPKSFCSFKSLICGWRRNASVLHVVLPLYIVVIIPGWLDALFNCVG